MTIAFKQNQICRWNPETGFEIDGVPVYIVGTNYVARYICTNFWQDWRPEVVASDLDRIAGIGLNAVRIPVHWEYAEPAPGKFRPEMFERFEAFLDMARERGLFVMPWFLVGVATQDYDVSWRNGESFFSERMTASAANHLRTFVERFHKAPNILCWDICDEPEWYSRHPGADQLPYNTDGFHHWMERIYQAIKAADPEHTVTLAFGRIAGGHYGMDIRRAARTLDVMTVTAYPPHMNEDLVNGFRSTYFPGWSARFNDCVRKGVFTCEAPGWSDIAASEENIGAYYRVSLFSNLANGSQGVMPWVWNDFDDAIQHLPPMDKYTIEKRFGITRKDGSLKPAGRELQRFAEFVTEFPPLKWAQVQPEVAVLVPAIKPEDAHAEFDSIFHHYIFLRQAGLHVRYVWMEDFDQFGGDILFLPASRNVPLLTGQWQKLQAWVKKGGVLVTSSGHVSSVFNELFGVIVEGCVKAYEPICFHDCREPVAACDGFELPAGQECLRVRAQNAVVLCRNGEGRPLVTQNAFGDGQAVHICYAPETALDAIHPEKLASHGIHALYRGLAADAGLSCPVFCADPRIELDVRRHADGRLLAVAINHSRYPVETVLQYGSKKKRIALSGSGVTWEEF